MKPMMSTEELSKRLDIPVGTLRYWRSVSTGPKSARIGRRVYYREEDVQSWLAEQFEADEESAA